ncbi:MAG: sugar phosphate nucleotidyltransferase [Acidobacteria bacterium]|nr:sugar phosphate nucleotidyltransferase [Acidobacteriota bacterium]
MKGIILAGGLGTRLRPLTKVTNKHLLPVYDKPMIFYPLEVLVDAGITDIMVVTGGNNAGDFLRLLGNGREFGLHQLHFAYQEGEGGIAEALSLAKYFAGEDLLCVYLGDNIIEDSIRTYVEKFKKQARGAKILLKEVANCERFGVPELKDDKVVKIYEKPRVAPSKYAVTGIYMYDPRVFDIITTLEPSQRGELEITDVNNRYIEWGELTYDVLEGWWTDAGTFDSLLRANKLVAQRNEKSGHTTHAKEEQGKERVAQKPSKESSKNLQ